MEADLQFACMLGVTVPRTLTELVEFVKQLQFYIPVNAATDGENCHRIRENNRFPMTRRRSSSFGRLASPRRRRSRGRQCVSGLRPVHVARRPEVDRRSATRSAAMSCCSRDATGAPGHVTWCCESIDSHRKRSRQQRSSSSDSANTFSRFLVNLSVLQM